MEEGVKAEGQARWGRYGSGYRGGYDPRVFGCTRKGDTRQTADSIGSDTGVERSGGFQGTVGKLGRLLSVLSVDGIGSTRSPDGGMSGQGKRALVESGDGNGVGEARNIWEEKDGEVFGLFLLRYPAVIMRAMEDEGQRWRSVRVGIRGLLPV